MGLYLLTTAMREKYPEESSRWENLLMRVSNPSYRGCYTCKFYNSIPNEKFIDIESLIDDVDDDWLPWDTEEAWVYCSEESCIETPLKINCKNWQVSEKID